MYDTKRRYYKTITNDTVMNGSPCQSEDEHKKLHIAMYSAFFSDISDSIMCTDNMYEILLSEVQAVIANHPVNKDIVLTIFENSPHVGRSVQFDSVIVGFRHFVSLRHKRYLYEFIFHSSNFLFFAIVGIVIEYIICEVNPTLFSTWGNTILDIISWTLIWQFIAFIAFEVYEKVKNLIRLSQITRIKYIFKHWE